MTRLKNMARGSGSRGLSRISSARARRATLRVRNRLTRLQKSRKTLTRSTSGQIDSKVKDFSKRTSLKKQIEEGVDEELKTQQKPVKDLTKKIGYLNQLGYDEQNVYKQFYD